MAIDTARKRASVLSYANVTRTYVVPQSGVPQADQQTLEHFYGGILATLPPVSTNRPNATMFAMGKFMNR